MPISLPPDTLFALAREELTQLAEEGRKPYSTALHCCSSSGIRALAGAAVGNSQGNHRSDVR